MSKRRQWIAAGVIAIVTIVLGGAMSYYSSPDRDDYYIAPASPTADAVTIVDVTDCVLETTGYAKANAEITVSRPLSYVGLGGDFKRSDGVVIGQGIGNLSDPVPGQTYIVEILYGLNTAAGQGGTCTVRIDTVYD